MFRWRCVVEGSSTESGTGGAGNRAARFPIAATCPPRLPRSANDNQAPVWVRVIRAAFLVALAGLALVWLKM